MKVYTAGLKYLVFWSNDYTIQLTYKLKLWSTKVYETKIQILIISNN